MTSLNVSGCTSLKKLDCSYHRLTSLNVAGCIALTSLNCESNQLTSLDVSSCTNLKYLYCQWNKITSVIPEWFSRFETFDHDLRYNYYWDQIKQEKCYSDKGYGWWYPGEPEKGYHFPD